MSTAIETERKFALATGQQLPRLDSIAIVGSDQQLELISVYYDTRDFRLNAARQVIRRRTGGPDAGWQAKLPTENPDDRLEIRLPAGGQRLPPELRELVLGTVGEEALFPVAELRTRRRQRELLDAEGRVLALVCIDWVTSTVAGRTQEWTEAEVELAGGEPQLLDRIEQAFAASGILRSQSSSKLAHAVAEHLAQVDAGPPTTPSAAEVIVGYLCAQIGVLQSLEEPAVRDEYDAVHRRRVATRRLRSTLKTFRGVFRPSPVRTLREELRWHAEQLGAPRDAEVLQQLLAEAMATLPSEASGQVAERVDARLARRHQLAHRELVSGMTTERYLRLQLDLEQLLAVPPLDRMAAEPAEVILPTMFLGAVQRARRQAERAEARPSDLARWHELRKAAKAVRYGAEALRPVLGGEAEELVEQWTVVTTALGEVQDAVIAAQVIADAAWEAVADGAQRQPFDDLRAHQDGVLRTALSRAREAVAVALRS